MSQQDSSFDTSAEFPVDQLHAPLPPVKSPAAPLREGLPPTYRMRADAHYVDLLTARTPGVEQQLQVSEIETSGESVDDASIEPLVDSVRRHGILQPLLVQKRAGGRFRLIAGKRRLAAAHAAGLREVPCLVHDANQEKAKALAEASNIRASAGVAANETPAAGDVAAGSPAAVLLEQSLATLMACSTALGAVSSTWTRGGVTELVRAEAWRALSLSTSMRLLRGEMPFVRSHHSIARLVHTVIDAFGPELRVRAARVDADVAKALQAPVDAHLLGSAIANAIFLTLGVLDGREGAQIAVAASSDEAALTIVVSQQHAGVADTWASRVLDQSWTARPGGEMAYVAAHAVRAAAERHGGACQLTGTSRDTRVSITIPAFVN